MDRNELGNYICPFFNVRRVSQRERNYTIKCLHRNLNGEGRRIPDCSLRPSLLSEVFHSYNLITTRRPLVGRPVVFVNLDSFENFFFFLLFYIYIYIYVPMLRKHCVSSHKKNFFTRSFTSLVTIVTPSYTHLVWHFF